MKDACPSFEKVGDRYECDPAPWICSLTMDLFILPKARNSPACPRQTDALKYVFGMLILLSFMEQTITLHLQQLFSQESNIGHKMRDKDSERLRQGKIHNPAHHEIIRTPRVPSRHIFLRHLLHMCSQGSDKNAQIFVSL